MNRKDVLAHVKTAVPTSATLFAVVRAIREVVDVPEGHKLDLESRRVFHHLDLRYTGKSADYEVAYWDTLKFLHGSFRCLTCGSSKPGLKKPGTLLLGWTPYCSDSCSKRSEKAVGRRKATSLERYGVENVSKNYEVKQKIAESWSRLDRNEITNKILTTTASRYGGGDLKKARKAIQEKRAATNLERYGSVCPLNAPGPRSKCLNTWEENLGVRNPSHSWQVIDKITRSFKRRKTVNLQGREFHVQGYEDQALHWLVSKGVKVSHIECSSYKRVSIPYWDSIKKRRRLYFPDFQFYHKGIDWLMEVKSDYWAGLTPSPLSKTKWLNFRRKMQATLNAGHNLVVYINDRVWFFLAYSKFPSKSVLKKELYHDRTKEDSRRTES